MSNAREWAIAGVACFEVRLDSRLQHFERRRRIVGELEQLEVLAVDHAVPDQRVEVDDLVPVARSVEHDRNAALDLARLHQRQDFAHLVERAEAAGKHHQRARQVREPELAHEEVVELERQLAREIGIRPLLVRQADVEADRLAAGVATRRGWPPP